MTLRISNGPWTDSSALGQFGPRLLKGFGYPNEVMSDAQDALAIQIILAYLKEGK